MRVSQVACARFRCQDSWIQEVCLGLLVTTQRKRDTSYWVLTTSGSSWAGNCVPVLDRPFCTLQELSSGFSHLLRSFASWPPACRHMLGFSWPANLSDFKTCHSYSPSAAAAPSGISNSQTFPFIPVLTYLLQFSKISVITNHERQLQKL